MAFGEWFADELLRRISFPSASVRRERGIPSILYIMAWAIFKETPTRDIYFSIEFIELDVEVDLLESENIIIFSG